MAPVRVSVPPATVKAPVPLMTPAKEPLPLNVKVLPPKATAPVLAPESCARVWLAPKLSVPSPVNIVLPLSPPLTSLKVAPLAIVTAVLAKLPSPLTVKVPPLTFVAPG